MLAVYCLCGEDIIVGTSSLVVGGVGPLGLKTSADMQDSSMYLTKFK
jgi:hypothetical protein